MANVSSSSVEFALSLGKINAAAGEAACDLVDAGCVAGTLDDGSIALTGGGVNADLAGVDVATLVAVEVCGVVDGHDLPLAVEHRGPGGTGTCQAVRAFHAVGTIPGPVAFFKLVDIGGHGAVPGALPVPGGHSHLFANSDGSFAHDARGGAITAGEILVRHGRLIDRHVGASGGGVQSPGGVERPHFVGAVAVEQQHLRPGGHADDDIAGAEVVVVAVPIGEQQCFVARLRIRQGNDAAGTVTHSHDGIELVAVGVFGVLGHAAGGGGAGGGGPITAGPARPAARARTVAAPRATTRLRANPCQYPHNHWDRQHKALQAAAR